MRAARLKKVGLIKALPVPVLTAGRGGVFMPVDMM